MVLFCLFIEILFWVFLPTRLSTVQYSDCPFCSHNGDFSGWPGVVDITPQMLGGHDAIGSAVTLPGNDRHLWDCGFGKGVQDFSAIADHTAVFLSGSRHEPRDIDKGDYRNIKAVAEPHKTGALDG